MRVVKYGLGHGDYGASTPFLYGEMQLNPYGHLSPCWDDAGSN